MINYAEVLADLQERRTNLDSAIAAIEPFVSNGNGTQIRGGALVEGQSGNRGE